MTEKSIDPRDLLLDAFLQKEGTFVGPEDIEYEQNSVHEMLVDRTIDRYTRMSTTGATLCTLKGFLMNGFRRMTSCLQNRRTACVKQSF